MSDRKLEKSPSSHHSVSLKRHGSKHDAAAAASSSHQGTATDHPSQTEVPPPQADMPPHEASALNIDIPNFQETENHFLQVMQVKQELDGCIMRMMLMMMIQVMKDMAIDKGMRRFKAEYERLYQALVRAHEGHRLLEQRCRLLTENAVDNSTLIQTSVDLSKQDQLNVAKMKLELDNTWRRLDVSCAKEDQARDVSRDLKREIALLESIIEDGASRNVDNDTALDELRNTNQDLMAHEEMKDEQIDQLHRKIIELESHGFEQLEHRLDKAHRRISELEAETNSANNKLLRSSTLHSLLVTKLNSARSEIEVKMEETKKIHDSFKRLQAEIEKLKRIRREQWDQLVVFRRAMASMRKDMGGLVFEAKGHAETVTRLNESVNAEKSIVKVQALELNAFAGVNRSMQNNYEKLRNRAEAALVRQHETESTVVNLKSDIRHLVAENNGAVITIKKNQALIEDMKTAEKALFKRMTRQYNESEEMAAQLLQQNFKLEELTVGVQKLKTEMATKDLTISQLEKTREHHLKEAAKASHYTNELFEKIQLLDLEVYQYKKTQLETAAKIKQDKELFEAVRTDRNQANRDLRASKNICKELQQKLYLSDHQLDQIKEELSLREALTLKQQMITAQVEKEKRALVLEMQEMKQRTAGGAAATDHLVHENNHLKIIIRNYVSQIAKIHGRLNQLESDRDVLGTQLVRRNDELSLLNQKIDVQAMALNKGHTQYNQRLDDIRVLKLEIRQLRHKNALQQQQCDIIGDMRLELLRLQKDLFQSRLRCQKLSEELTTPLNVHRWRKLEGVDVGLYEMALKMMRVQKLLIAKTEECTEKDLVLQQKDQINAAMKTIVASRPGLEVSNQLSLSKHAIRCRNRQLQAVTSELNMCRTQLKDYKYDIGQLRAELKQIKTVLFDMKKKDKERMQDHKSAIRISTCPTSPVHFPGPNGHHLGGPSC